MKPRGTVVNVRHDAGWGRHLKPWGVFWNVYEAGRTGRPKQRSKWYATEAEAREVQATVQAALASAAPLPVATEGIQGAADSLAERAKTWLAHVKKQREAATYKSYAEMVRNYLAPAKGHARYPGLGTVIVSDRTLHSGTIGKFLTALQEAGVSLSMRHRVHRGISAFCSYARSEGWLTKDNPALGLGRALRVKGEEVAEAVSNPFTRDEVARILDHVEACEPDWLPYFTFLYHTGVRPGEAAGLRWDTVDCDRLRVKIEWSWSPAAHADKLPKTHERRMIDLSRLAADRLLAWRPIQRQELLRRAVQQSPYVFTSRRGTRALQGGHIRVVFDRVMRACTITGHTLYDFRHSFASHHLGDDWHRKLPWVSKQLGHRHVSTTIKCYYAYQPTEATQGFADSIRGGL